MESLLVVGMCLMRQSFNTLGCPIGLDAGEEIRRKPKTFSEVTHRHDNPVASFQCARFIGALTSFGVMCKMIAHSIQSCLLYVPAKFQG